MLVGDGGGAWWWWQRSSRRVFELTRCRRWFAIGEPGQRDGGDDARLLMADAGWRRRRSVVMVVERRNLRREKRVGEMMNSSVLKEPRPKAWCWLYGLSSITNWGQKLLLLPRSLKNRGQKPDAGGIFENLKTGLPYMLRFICNRGLKPPLLPRSLKTRGQNSDEIAKMPPPPYRFRFSCNRGL